MMALSRIRAWWRRHFGPRRGRHIRQSSSALVLAYLSDVDFWGTQ